MSGVVPSLRSIVGKVGSGTCSRKDCTVCWFSFGVQEFY